jgi:hypothetical protein
MSHTAEEKTIDEGRQASIDRPAQEFRAREMAWREAHPEEMEKFAGKWLAMEGEEIVACGDDPASVIAAARAKGHQIPYVFQVLAKQPDMAHMGL